MLQNKSFGPDETRKSDVGFTLIELLIVIGILSVLVVTILITLNPAEAQKKVRDTKRMKDLATLQSIVEQYIADGKPPFCTSGCLSSSAGLNVQSQSCANSWIHPVDSYTGTSVDLCNYAKTIPLDPNNNAVRTHVYGEGTPSTATTTFTYRITMSGSDYKIGGLQESPSNIGNARTDGGNTNAWVEIFSSEVGKNLW